MWINWSYRRLEWITGDVHENDEWYVLSTYLKGNKDDFNTGEILIAE